MAHHETCKTFYRRGDIALWRDLLEESRTAPAPFTCASAEGFSRLSIREIDDLMDVAGQAGVEVSVIAFLRPPLAYATSVFSQRLKSGWDPWELFHSFGGALSHFESLLQNLAHWSHRVGAGNFRLAPFESGQWPGQSLWSAWWRALGITAPVAESDLPADLEVRNPSPSWMTLVAIAQLSKGLGERKAKIIPGHPFITRITRPVEEKLRALSGSRFVRPPRILDVTTQRMLQSRISPKIDQFADSLGLETPFFQSLETVRAEDDLAWFENPYDEALPAEERAMAAHLIDYAEALAAEELTKADGVVSAEHWLAAL